MGVKIALTLAALLFVAAILALAWGARWIEDNWL